MRFALPGATVEVKQRGPWFSGPASSANPVCGLTQVSLEQLRAIGVLHWTIPVEGHESRIEQLCKDQGYRNQDVVRRAVS